MVEPFIFLYENNTVRKDLSTEAVIRSIAVTSALGTSSASTWLKVPYVEHMERVMVATTLPAVTRVETAKAFSRSGHTR